MGPAEVLRIIMMTVGVLLLCITVSSLARRKMTESFCLSWGVISFGVILAGCVLQPTEWNRYISPTGLGILLIIGACILFDAYFISAKVSELMRKNQELAIQITLLNEENQTMEERLAQLEQQISGKA